MPNLPSELPIVESAPQRPTNPYGRSKLAGEQILADARTAEGLRVAMLRYFNAAGGSGGNWSSATTRKLT